MSFRRLVGVAVVVVLAGGCSTKKPIVPPDKLWSEGNTAFKDEAYELAVERFKALLDQHPFDANAEEAELKIGQAHYMAQRYPEAIAAFGDFERMHPTSASLPVVEYHLGLSYLAQGSTSDRETQSYTNALVYFRNIVDRFPSSPWAEKARLRMRECREALAGHEAGITAYYLRQGNMRAAEARLRGLLTEYPDTDATAQALYGFADAYAGRKEDQGETLVLATLAWHHPDDPLGREARQRLDGGRAGLDGADPLPLLVAHIDRMRGQADRQKVRPTVSAYPDGAAAGGSGY